VGETAKVKGKLLTVPVKDAALDSRVADLISSGSKAGQSGKEFNKYYTVKKGDTLASLARRFNVSAAILSAWNNLKGKVALRPGKRIIVAKYMEKQGTMSPVVEGNG